jgi:formate dehydrogenase alpha subunit
MTNPIADISLSDVILITGSNTTENHPVLSAYVKRAVTQEGKKLIVIDPRKIPITRYATLWLRQNLGTDVAWINCMMQVIISEGLYDKGFVETRTTGFDALKKKVGKYTPAYAEKITGIPADILVAAARMYVGGKPSTILYAMGITQHITGTDNVKSLANLTMLCGNLGKVGGGVNPLRGQNNVQGCCDMGCLPNVFPGYQKVDSPEVRKKFSRAWGVKELSAKPGLPSTVMMDKAHSVELKALYVIGENPMVSDPDLTHTQKSLEKLDLLVVQDIFMTETAQLADVVLPSASFAEKDGTFTNTERKVQLVRRAVDAPGSAREDWRIVAALASAMGYDMGYGSAEKIMAEITSLTPSYGGITCDRLQAGGLTWPCPNPDHPGTPRLHIDKFTHGQGVFHAIDYLPPAEVADAEYPVYLTTGRVLYQYHTGTMTMKSPGVHECEPECFVEIAGQDAHDWGISDHEKIKIISRRGSIEASARISDQAVSGTIFIPFHYAQAAVNRLTNGALDPLAKIPEFKVCAVRVEKKHD